MATLPPVSDSLTVSPRYSGLVWPVGVAAVGVVFLVAYYSTLQQLSDYWASNETYSFGFLVPVISAYLIWLRRDHLRELPRTPSIGLGTCVLGAGMTALIIGRLSSINLLAQISLPLSLYGLALLVLGWRLTRAMTFPLLYLLAMIPFWEFLTGRLHLPFQLYSAVMGVEALRLFGIPVLRDGVLIELPNITLEVAQLCSGVNNLVAVLCLGVPLTHFYVKGWLKRGFILSMAVLIALLSNGVRVATVCFFAYYGIRGADGDVHGPYALARTLVISGVGFIALFWLVSKFADRPHTPIKVSESGAAPHFAPWALHTAAWAVAVAILAGAVGYEHLHAVMRVPLNAHLVGFPNQIGGWQFERVGALFPALTNNANFDQWTSRVYAAPGKGELELLLGYFESQEPGRELGGFELARVIPSQATAVTERNSARVKDGLTRVNGKTYHLTYWYLVDGRVAIEGYEAKLWTTFNSITAGRSNGGLIVVGRALRDNESIEMSRAKIHEFVGEVMNASHTYFPKS